MTRFFLPVISIVIFMSFFRLGSTTLFDVDEAVFAEAAKEMVESGNWITPTYNGENRYDKPILFYWLMAVSYKIFGINEFAARFPSAMASLLLVLSVFFFVRHSINESNAFYTAISLVLSVYIFIYSHAAVTDMTLTLFITLSLFSFYLWRREDAIPTVKPPFKKTNLYIYGFYLFSAFAFLTKGLIGIVFPFGIAISYLLVTEGFAGIKKTFSLKGVVLFIAISAPWYVAQLAINGQEFIRQFFIKHHLLRYRGVISGHRGPIFYYIPVLIIGLFPWIAFLPSGIRSVFSVNVFKKKNSGVKTHSSELLLLALIWLIFIVVFFSFSATKLPNYVLPAVPAASILISSGMQSVQNTRWKQYANTFIAVTSVLIGTAFVISKDSLLKFGVYDTGWTLIVAALMLVMAILSLYLLLTKKTLYGYTSALMIVFLLVLSIKALPLVNQYLQGTLYKYSLYAKERLHNDERIITYGINNPSIVFYSGHKIINIGNKDELKALMTRKGDSASLAESQATKKGIISEMQFYTRTIAIAKAKDIEVFKDLGFNLLEKDGMYAILERE